MSSALHPEIAERKQPEPLLSELRMCGADVTRTNAIRCPFHDDQKPSAGVYERDDGVWRFKCHGCGFNEDFLGVRARRLDQPVEKVVAEYVHGDDDGPTDWAQVAGQSKPKADKPVSLKAMKAKMPGKVEAVYVYGEADAPRMAVFRCITPDGKTFRQAHPEGDGWAFGAPPKPWPLYNLARVKTADRVVVVEGEKCVHALHDIGIVATTSPAGAGKAEHADWTPLAGKQVILWPDHDEKGHAHMADVAGILEKLTPQPTVAHVKPEMLEMPGKGDVVEFLAMVDDPAAMHDATEAVLDAALPAGPAAEFESHLEDVIAGKFATAPWPWERLTDATEALRPGSVAVLCGEPEAGKSLWLMQCVRFWHDNGFKPAIYELEEDRNSHLFRALAQHHGLASLTRPSWVQKHPDEAREAFAEHRAWVDSIGRVIWHSPKELVTIDGLIEWVAERAAAGHRIIAVDPVTALEATAKPWVTDLKLVIKTKTLAVQHGCSIVFVTHPRIGLKKGIGLDGIAGGAAYPRFAQCVLVLAKHHPPESGNIATAFGGTREQHFDRSLFIRKARHSWGGGSRIAMNFEKESLTFGWVGPVTEDEA